MSLVHLELLRSASFIGSDFLSAIERSSEFRPATSLESSLLSLGSSVGRTSDAWPIADLFVGTTAIVSGVVVVVVVLARWSFFAQTDRARALASALGESVARGVYLCGGVTLVALGIWVLRG